MKATTTLAAALTSIAALLGSAGPAEAASFAHLDRYAVRLQEQAEGVSRFLRTHYVHHREYRHLSSDALTALITHLPKLT